MQITWIIRFEIPCKLFPEEASCMKWPTLFSGKNNVTSLSSAEYAHRVLKVKLLFFLFHANWIRHNSHEMSTLFSRKQKQKQQINLSSVKPIEYERLNKIHWELVYNVSGWMANSLHCFFMSIFRNILGEWIHYQGRQFLQNSFASLLKGGIL